MQPKTEQRPYNAITVSELSKCILDIINSNDALKNACVIGEVTNLMESKAKNLYFDLKDENAKIRCVVYREDRGVVDKGLKDGVKAVVFGKVGYYEPLGSVQLYAMRVEVISEGDYLKQIEELKKKLKEQGMFDEKYKKAIPKLPERIGIISAKDGAGLKDVITSIRCRFPNVDIFVKYATMQGKSAVKDICEGIEYFDNHFKVDVIIIARGGGSIEDLEPFNNEEIARAIFNAKTPIITGIGHKEDVTVADYVADCMAITPTEAGRIAVQDKAELMRKIDELEIALRKAYETFKNIKKKERQMKKMQQQIKKQHEIVRKAERSKYIYIAIILVLLILLLLSVWWL